MADADDYTVRMEGIRFRGKHGVSKSERSLPQDFRVTVEVSLPYRCLPRTDEVKDVFDYDRISNLVVDEGTRQQCKLLETLAQRLIGRILQDTPATRVVVSVTKSHPPTSASVDCVVVTLSSHRANRD
jgi:dihydroneopterin aldolase